LQAFSIGIIGVCIDLSFAVILKPSGKPEVNLPEYRRKELKMAKNKSSKKPQSTQSISTPEKRPNQHQQQEKMPATTDCR
jgi:hypothetical protein